MASGGKPVSGDVRDVRWFTHNSLVGFPMMGIWEEGRASPSDLNTVDRSRGGRHLATGDDDGWGPPVVSPFTHPTGYGPSPPP